MMTENKHSPNLCSLADEDFNLCLLNDAFAAPRIMHWHIGPLLIVDVPGRLICANFSNWLLHQPRSGSRYLVAITTRACLKRDTLRRYLILYPMLPVKRQGKSLELDQLELF